MPPENHKIHLLNQNPKFLKAVAKFAFLEIFQKVYRMICILANHQNKNLN